MLTELMYNLPTFPMAKSHSINTKESLSERPRQCEDAFIHGHNLTHAVHNIAVEQCPPMRRSYITDEAAETAE